MGSAASRAIWPNTDIRPLGGLTGARRPLGVGLSDPFLHALGHIGGG